MPSARPLAAAVLVAAWATGLAGCAPAGASDGTAGSAAGEAASSLGWQDALTGGSDRLDVATTVAPISSIARNVGGDRIRLRGIVPDGTNSHTFEPAPSDARTLAAADLVIANGLALERPTLEMADASIGPAARVVLLGDAAISRSEWLFDFSFPESAGDPNPHLWMSVPHARRYAELIRDAFAAADPANEAAYAANTTAYVARLDELDALIRKGVATVPEANRRLLTYHDSWAYWAREYGFTVIGAVQASDFSDPSPQEVARLIRQVRETKVPAVFGSEVFPSPVLEQIARESGARFVDELRDDDPPGEPGSAEHTYLGMMKKDMQVMIGALGGDPTVLDPLPVADTWRS